MSDVQLIKDNTEFENQLAEHRKQIDAIDEKIFALIKERSAIVHKVGDLKNEHQPGACPLKPGREARQLRRVVDTFKGTDFLPAAAATMWRMMIMSSLSLEGDIRISVFYGEQDRELFWLAREYFGSFSEFNRVTTPKRVIGDLLDGKAEIGVLPRFEDHEFTGGRWWTDIPNRGKDRPLIFAALPFVHASEPTPNTKTGFAIGMVKPEETGNDLSYLMIEVEDTVSQHGMQAAFAKAGLEARWIEASALVPGKRHHLVEVKGFVIDETGSYKAFATEIGNALIQTAFLGAVAAPIILEPKAGSR